MSTAVRVAILRAFVQSFCTMLFIVSSAAAQQPQTVTGEAILKHPIGQLSIKAADLLRAGKVEEAIALQPKEAQAEWKKESDQDRKAMAAMKQRRAPSVGFADAIRKAGVLQINGTSANLRVDLGAEGEGIAMAELEGGQWRLSVGPMVMEAAPKTEVRVEGADLVKHPIVALAMQYVDLIHAGKMDEAMRLATTKAQANWKAEPASERAESTAYRRKNLPTSAQLKAALPNSVLIVGDGRLATLNVISTTQRSQKPGTVAATSTTSMIPFAMENGQWRLAQ